MSESRVPGSGPTDETVSRVCGWILIVGMIAAAFWCWQRAVATEAEASEIAQGGVVIASPEATSTAPPDDDTSGSGESQDKGYDWWKEFFFPSDSNNSGDGDGDGDSGDGDSGDETQPTDQPSDAPVEVTLGAEEEVIGIADVVNATKVLEGNDIRVPPLTTVRVTNGSQFPCHIELRDGGDVPWEVDPDASDPWLDPDDVVGYIAPLEYSKITLVCAPSSEPFAQDADEFTLQSQEPEE